MTDQAIAAAVKRAMTPSESDPVVSVVHETYEYDKFEVLKSNRPINESHVIRLAESMQEEYLLSPIVVNKNFWIIDGQHRFTAAKDKGLPIRYIIGKNYGLEQMKMYNVNSSNWGKKDFLDHYVTKGCKQYIDFKGFMNTYPFFSFASAFNLLAQSGDNKAKKVGDKRILTKHFDKGLFVIKDYGFSVQVADAIKSMKPYLFRDQKGVITHLPFYNNRTFLTIMRHLISKNDYDHDRMIHKLKVHGSKLLYKCTTADEFYQMLEKIYNFKSPNDAYSLKHMK